MASPAISKHRFTNDAPPTSWRSLKLKCGEAGVIDNVVRVQQTSVTTARPTDCCHHRDPAALHTKPRLARYGAHLLRCTQMSGTGDVRPLSLQQPVHLSSRKR